MNFGYSGIEVSRVPAWKCAAHPLTRFLIQASKVFKGMTFTYVTVISLIPSSTKPVFPAGRRKNFATAV